MPGPAPYFQPTFTQEHVTELESLARKATAPHSWVQRAKLALLLHAEPQLDSPTIARHLGQHLNWVRYWRKRWATEGFTLEALHDKSGRGRKPKLSCLPAGDGEGHRL
jgi:hypothetical protein